MNYGGEWKVSNFNGRIDCRGLVFRINHADDSSTLEISVAIVNTLWVKIVFDPYMRQWQSTGGVMSSYMMGPPALMQKENIIGDFLGHINGISYNRKGRLQITESKGEKMILNNQAVTAIWPSHFTTNRIKARTMRR